MALLDLLKTIGEAKPGTRMLVVAPFDAVNASVGGTVHLPHGTPIQITFASGGSVSATADLGGRLQRVYIFVEQYACLASQ